MFQTQPEVRGYGEKGGGHRIGSSHGVPLRLVSDNETRRTRNVQSWQSARGSSRSRWTHLSSSWFRSPTVSPCVATRNGVCFCSPALDLNLHPRGDWHRRVIASKEPHANRAPFSPSLKQNNVLKLRPRRGLSQTRQRHSQADAAAEDDVDSVRHVVLLEEHVPCPLRSTAPGIMVCSQISTVSQFASAFKCLPSLSHSNE